MAGLDRTGKTQADSRAAKFRQILNFVAADEEVSVEKAESAQPPTLVPISAIHLPASQPRRYFDPQKLDQLAASIKEHGILENLLVRPLARQGQYELIAGERRYRAAQKIGLTEVPVTIRDLTDIQALEIALIENLQREDLNPVEETEGILHLLAVKLELEVQEIPPILYRMQNEAKGKITQNVLGNSTGQVIQAVFQELGLLSWESFTSSRLPLLNMPPEILEALRQGKIAYTKAQAIGRLKHQQQREVLLEEAIAQNLSLNEIKQKIKESKPDAEVDSTSEQLLINRMAEITRRLKKGKVLGQGKKRDRITKLLDELERLTQED